MSRPCNLRDETGVGNRAAPASDTTYDDDLKNKLQYFEELVDKSDPACMEMLEQMREDTRRLEQSRGIWSKRGSPGGKGDWNDFNLPKESPAPLDNKEFRQYNAHLEGTDGPVKAIALNSASAASESKLSSSKAEVKKDAIVSTQPQTRVQFLQSRGLLS